MEKILYIYKVLISKLQNRIVAMNYSFKNGSMNIAMFILVINICTAVVSVSNACADPYGNINNHIDYYDVNIEFKYLNIPQCRSKEMKYIQIIGNSEDIIKINKELKKPVLDEIAPSLKVNPKNCDLGEGNYFFPIQVFAKDPFVSVVYKSGNSMIRCHNSYQIRTFDLNSAKVLFLKDIIKEGSSRALFDKVKELMKQQYQYDKSEDMQNLTDDYWIDHLLTNYFFIEDKKVKISFDEMMSYSCASDPISPIEIPEKFIRSEFLDLLHRN